MRICVFRHPRVLDPTLCYGKLDVPIASWDETKAILEGQREWLERFRAEETTLLTSPRTRCRMVASWFEAFLEKEATVVESMAEMDLGSFEGHTFSALEERADFQNFMGHWQTATAPEGESIPLFERRVRALVEERRGTVRENVEIWVAHAGIIRALHVIVGGKSWDEAMREKIDHLEPYEFEL